MHKSTIYPWLSRFYFSNSFGVGIWASFWALWLVSQGVSPEFIGIILGTSGITRCVSNLAITPNINKKTHLIPVLRLLVFSMPVLFVGFFLVTPSYIGLLLITVLFSLAWGPTTALMDTLVNYYHKLNILDYGRTRLWASLGFIFGIASVGAIIGRFGVAVTPYIYLISLAISFIILLPSPKPLPVEDETENHTAKVKFRTLLSNKNIRLFILANVLIQGSHAAFYSFGTLYLNSIGCNEITISALWNLGVVAEIILFAFSQKIFANCSINTMMRLATCGAILRWSLMTYTENIYLIALSQCLHALTFATMHLSAMRYISSFSHAYQVPLQSLYNALCLSAGIAIFSALLGPIYTWQPHYIFAAMALLVTPVLFIKLSQSN